MNSVNCYEDANRANAYATLEFTNTYYLAYRDLPEILSAHVIGRRALDFGCGTGRSTRMLRKLGFDVTGVDVSKDMLRIAKVTDPSGDYRLVPGDNLEQLTAGSFDLVFCAFPFDNVPGGMKARILCDLSRLQAPTGTIVNLVSSPEIYTNEWASFTTKDFPENTLARSGDPVRIVVTDHQDRRPVEDILCTDESYRTVYHEAGLQVVQVLKPLAKGDEPYSWVSENEDRPLGHLRLTTCQVALRPHSPRETPSCLVLHLDLALGALGLLPRPCFCRSAALPAAHRPPQVLTAIAPLIEIDILMGTIRAVAHENGDRRNHSLFLDLEAVSSTKLAQYSKS